MSPWALLLLGGALHYGWQWFPEHAAFVWNIAGSLTRVILLWALIRCRGGMALAVGLWWTAEELLLIGCNALYILNPWPVKKGEAICSAMLQYDLGTIGLLVVAILGWQLARMRNRG